MKKKRNFIFKICSALLMAFIFVLSFTCKSYAWYVNENGNLQSSNLMNSTFINNNSLSITSYHTISEYGLNSNTDYTLSFQNLTSDLFYYRINWSSSNYTSWVRSDHSLTFNTASYEQFSIISDRIYNSSLYNLMLNSGSTALEYEPYGAIYYSQTDYENYYDTGYGVGYNAGINHAYNQLGSSVISPLVSGSSIAKFDVNNENFISRTNINDVNVNGDYYFLNWSRDIDYWYHITLGWNDYYIIKDIGFTPGNFTSVIVTVNGIDFSNISYNGTYYGVFNIQDTTMTPVNQITISVKMNSSEFNGVNLYVSSFNNGIEDVQEAFNNGYEQGIKTGKDSGYKLGYDDGYSEGSTQGNTGRKLFWTIASTPFESFKTIWNVDVLGLNISGIILGLLMALLVIYLIKKIWK